MGTLMGTTSLDRGINEENPETLAVRVSLMVGAGLMPRRISQQRDHDDAVTLVRRMAEVIERRDLDPK